MLFVVPYCVSLGKRRQRILFLCITAHSHLKRKNAEGCFNQQEGAYKEHSNFLLFWAKALPHKIRTEQQLHEARGAWCARVSYPFRVRVGAGRFESHFLELKCAHRVFSLEDHLCPPLKRKPQLNIYSYSDRTVTRDTFKLSKIGWP